MRAQPSSFARIRRNLPAQYLWPVLLLLGTCFGCIFAIMFSTADAQDRLQVQREEQVLQIALKSANELIVHDLQDYARWDDAVRNISWRLDPEWMMDNVIAYLGITQNYTRIFVVDGQNHTVYMFGEGRPGRGDALAELGDDFRAALNHVRKLPIENGPILSGFTRKGDTLYIYSVAAVVPLTRKVELPPGPTKLLVIARRVDAAFLARIAHDQGLAPLTLRLGRPGPGELAASLDGHGGRVHAWLSWAPRRPGTDVRRDVLPSFVAVLLMALVAAGLILRRGGRTIEALRDSEARARHHANHDPLTGLPNRRALVTRIHEAMAAGERPALLFMDLDGFKDANDVYGHAAGDLLLFVAARRIEAAAAPALVARAGGDEFAVLIADPGERDVAAIANAILAAFQRPFAIGAYSVTAGVSIGSAEDRGGDRGAADALAAIAAPEAGGDELMRRADVAMYAAKADGKNCWRAYDDKMDGGHVLRMRMEGDLRAAVAAGDIRVLFQPVVRAATGAIVAVEALARWSHPTHGEVPPDVFIPLAEMSGLISALGRHVLVRACTEAKDLGLCVAVNLSPAQFWDRKLAQDVRSALADTGFPANRLELEITESFLLRRPEAAAAVIDELRALGICIALDDFGTGFASIGYLRQLSFDRLKIDKDFISPLGTDPRAADLVAAIVALARSLGLEITAEGVETEAQANLAWLAGCTRLQGWLYGRPMSAAQVRDLCDAAAWVPAVARVG